MEFDQVITVALCVGASFAALLPVAIAGTKMRLDMAHQELSMRRQGTYAAWAAQNRQVVRQHQIVLAILVSSFVAFVLLGILSSFAPFAGTLAQVAIGLCLALFPVTLWTHWRLYCRLTRNV